MSFLANLNSFFLANEVAVVTTVAVALILFQLTLLASAFLNETAVSPTANEQDGVEGNEETAVVANNYDVWTTYTYAPWGF